MELTEADIESSCRELLEACGFWVHPKQRTRCPHCHRAIGDKRTIDIVSCAPDGIFVVIENKDKKTGTNTKEKKERFADQLTILECIRSKSGHACVAYTREQLIESLTRWGYLA